MDACEIANFLATELFMQQVYNIYKIFKFPNLYVLNVINKNPLNRKQIIMSLIFLVIFHLL